MSIELAVQQPPSCGSNLAFSGNLNHTEINGVTATNDNTVFISNNTVINNNDTTKIATTTSTDVTTTNETKQEHSSDELLHQSQSQTQPILPKPRGPLDECDINPEFAIICSFINQFGDKLNLELDIERLKLTLEDSEIIHDDLVEIHVKLLRKRRKYFLKDQWERALIKFALEYSYEDALELETFGYKDTRPSVRMEILRRLMEAQFDCDNKLKLDINLCDANELRPLPMGRDNRGHIYWNRLDGRGNFIIFREWCMDYKSWRAVCHDKAQLDELIGQLEKTTGESMAGEPMMEPINQLPDIFPELFVQEEAEGKESPPKKRKGKGKGRGRGGKAAQLRNVSAIQENPSSSAIPEDNLTEGIVRINTSEDKPSCNHTEKNNYGLSYRETATCGPYSHKIKQERDLSDANDSVESQVTILLDNLIIAISNSKQETITNRSEDMPTLLANQTKSTGGRPKKKVAKPKVEKLPRRTSSRIQQLQIKKMAEEEEEMKKKIAEREAAEAKKKAEKEHATFSEQEFVDDDNSQSIKSNNASKDKKKSRRGSSSERSPNRGDKKRLKKRTHQKKGRGKKKMSWDKDDSDLSESSSSSSGIDDLEDQDETLKFDDNDDEFACEEEDANAEPVIVKRARTASKARENDHPVGDANGSIAKPEEDKPCGRCGKSDDPEWILLCDRCDDGYHTTCCIPPLMFIPDGDWFCPPCEHKMLLEKLYEHRTFIMGVLETREREMKKKQRIRQPKPQIEPQSEDIEPLANLRIRALPDELAEPLALQYLDEEEEASEYERDRHDDYQMKASRRHKKRVNHRQSRKKEKSTSKRSDDLYEVRKPSKTYSRRPFESKRAIESNYSGTENPSDEGESNLSSDEEVPMARRAKRQVSYRFKEYDDLINSAIKGDPSYDEGAANCDEDEVEDEEVVDEEDELAEGFKSRGKDMATIEALANSADDPFPPLAPLPTIDEQATESNKPDEKDPSQNQAMDETTNRRGRGKKKKKGRRLNDLDSPSGTELETSDESFIASAASEIEEDEDDLISDPDATDTSMDEIAYVSRSKPRKGRASARKPKHNRHSDYVYQESDSDYEPYQRRRASSKRVSYKESTDEEYSDDEYTKKKTKKKKKRGSSSDESDEPWNIKKFTKDKFIVEDDDDEEYDDEMDQDEGDEELGLEEDQSVTDQSSPSNLRDLDNMDQVDSDTRQSEFIENKEQV